MAIPIRFLTNDCKVSVIPVSQEFYHYKITDLKTCEGIIVDHGGVRNKVVEKFHERLWKEDQKVFAFDGCDSIYTVGPLPFPCTLEDPPNRFQYSVWLEGFDLRKHGSNSIDDGERKKSKIFDVELLYLAKIPIQDVLGHDLINIQKVLKILNNILHDICSLRGCIEHRKSFFENNPLNLCDLGGGVLGCRGIQASFRSCQGVLSLNTDVSTTVIIKPGPVVEFLIANQNVGDTSGINWALAKKTLKKLRIQVPHSSLEYIITGLSVLPCNQQQYILRQSTKGNGDHFVEENQITVYDFYLKHHKTALISSAHLPCIIVGKSNRVQYFPLEICSLVPLQRYTEAPSPHRRLSTRLKPADRSTLIQNAIQSSSYEANPLLRSAGILVQTNFTEINGHVLSAPRFVVEDHMPLFSCLSGPVNVGDLVVHVNDQSVPHNKTLKFGNIEFFLPKNGRWSYKDRTLALPVGVERWGVVNFSSPNDVTSLVEDLMKMGSLMGFYFDKPKIIIDEDPGMIRESSSVRVEHMFAQLKKIFPKTLPIFLLCLFQGKKSLLYGPWKKKTIGNKILTQCLSTKGVNNLILANVILKINVKLGGLNFLLAQEVSRSIPLVSGVPTIIFGMSVSHGPPNQPLIPSVASVVSLRNWPYISQYRAVVRTQTPRMELIESLFKPISTDKDEGIISELLKDFCKRCNPRKRIPEQIIIFRNGVADSQFEKIKNLELHQIRKAFKFFDPLCSPKITLIVAQKQHRMRYFLKSSQANVPPGTVTSNWSIHAEQCEFSICPQYPSIGTTKPVRYRVLVDEVGFSTGQLRDLVHSLSYLCQRSTSAMSIVAPIHYARLTARQISRSFFEVEKEPVTITGSTPLPKIPDLPHTMFFS